MKKCSKCCIEKPLSEFYNQKLGKNGKRADCKKCANLFSNTNWEKYHYKKYGISLTQKQQMIKNQNNSCALCKKQFTNKYNTCVDHCHKTGKIRGVLCRACNSALGQLGDSIQSLTLAIKYLSHGETKL